MGEEEKFKRKEQRGPEKRRSSKIRRFPFQPRSLRWRVAEDGKRRSDKARNTKT